MFSLAHWSSFWEPEFNVPRICFLFWTVISLPLQFISLPFCFSVVLSFFVSALLVFSLTVMFFLHSIFRACSLPSCFCTLSLFLMISASFFSCPVFLHSIFFVISCVLSFAHFPFPPSLSLFPRFPFYLSNFYSTFYFLLFFLQWVPVLMFFVALYSFCFFLSHQLRFFFNFLSLIPFFSLPLAFSHTLVFFSVFLLCFRLSFFWVFLILNLFALRLII